MCSRFYVSKNGIMHVARSLAVKPSEDPPAGEIRPNDDALMIYSKGEEKACRKALWGFIGREKSLVINARSETAFAKPMFSSSMISRRCLLAAEKFYEWDQNKNLVTFTDPERPIMLLAGIWNVFESSVRFTVLTTEANASMISVHDRMPLMISFMDAESWLFSESDAKRLLKEPMPMLISERNSEQLTLF